MREVHCSRRYTGFPLFHFNSIPFLFLLFLEVTRAFFNFLEWRSRIFCYCIKEQAAQYVGQYFVLPTKCCESIMSFVFVLFEWPINSATNGRCQPMVDARDANLEQSSSGVSTVNFRSFRGYFRSQHDKFQDDFQEYQFSFSHKTFKIIHSAKP